jgi:hypothetical protein
MGDTSCSFVPIDSDKSSVCHAQSSFNEEPIVCRTMLAPLFAIAPKNAARDAAGDGRFPN